MSIQKQELLESIESLPEELAKQVIDFMEYLKFTYASNKAPENLIIKDKEDLIKKLEKGIADTDSGNVCSLEEAYEEVKAILAE